jgi:hypothetical protein
MEIEARILRIFDNANRINKRSSIVSSVNKRYPTVIPRYLLQNQRRARTIRDFSSGSLTTGRNKNPGGKMRLP